jgi:hypothetical protein
LRHGTCRNEHCLCFWFHLMVAIFIESTGMHEKPEMAPCDGRRRHRSFQVLIKRIGYMQHHQQTLIYQSEMVLPWSWQVQVAWVVDHVWSQDGFKIPVREVHIVFWKTNPWLALKIGKEVQPCYHLVILLQCSQ